MERASHEEIKRSTIRVRGIEVDLWSGPYSEYCTKEPTDYIQQRILQADKDQIDLFPDIAGKKDIKDAVSQALLSGSCILFKSRRGYGKTTFAKAIGKAAPPPNHCS